MIIDKDRLFFLHRSAFGTDFARQRKEFWSNMVFFSTKSITFAPRLLLLTLFIF